MCGQDCETDVELDYSLRSLDNWLSLQTNVTQALRTVTEDFLIKSFKPRIEKLAQCHFQKLYGGSLGSNTLSEQENSALKRSPVGPSNNSGIDRSVAATVQYEKGRLRGMMRDGLHSLSQTYMEDIDINDNENKTEDPMDGILSSRTHRNELSKVLVDHALSDVFRQYDASVFYKYYVCSDTHFYVRRFTWANPVKNAQIPKFDRTRVVTIQNSKYTYKMMVAICTATSTNLMFYLFKECLVCSCGKFCLTGRPCRHIYCILQRPPKRSDCNLKQLKTFEAFCGNDNKLTDIFTEHMNYPLEGPLVGDSLILEPNNPSWSDDSTWFLEALDSIVLRPGVVSNNSLITTAAVNTMTNFADPPPDSPTDFIFGANDDNDNDGTESDTFSGDAFGALAPNLSRVCGLIENASDLAVANRVIDKLYHDLLERKSGKVQDGNGTATTFSLPETAKGRKQKRKAPPGSPSRWKSIK